MPTPRPEDGHCDAACGTLGGHFRFEAADFLVSAGYDPADYPEVLAEIEQAVPEAMVDTAYDVMRDHGLRPETDPLAPANVLTPA